jgi:hypothetical protein
MDTRILEYDGGVAFASKTVELHLRVRRWSCIREYDSGAAFVINTKTLVLPEVRD